MIAPHGLAPQKRCASVPAGLVHIPHPRQDTARKLYQAVKGDSLDELAAMLDSGVNPDDPSQCTPSGSIPTQPGGRNALHFAVIYGNLEMVQLLLARGANPNTCDRFGWQPLHFAALNGRSESKLKITQLLLDAGGDRRAPVAVQNHSTMAARRPLLGRPHANAAADFARKHGQTEVAELIDAYQAPVPPIDQQ